MSHSFLQRCKKILRHMLSCNYAKFELKENEGLVPWMKNNFDCLTGSGQLNTVINFV